MADDIKSGALGEQDPLKNLKEEFSRKMGNVEKNMSSLEATNKQLLAQLQSLAPKPQAAAPSKTLANQWFDNPDGAADEIVQRAVSKVQSQWQQANEDNARQQSTLSSLVSEFPELSNGNHELTKEAVKIYDALSVEEKRSPIAYKAAVKEAALDLGYKPMKKRSEDEQEFYLKGGNSSGSSERKPRAAKIDDATLEFARRVGIDVSDQKVKDRFTNKHGRKTYTRYE